MSNCKILSFDPGITVTGWACGVYHPDTHTLTIQKYGMIKPSTLSKEHKDDCKVYGNQVISLHMLNQSVMELINQYKPSFVVTEDAFSHRFVQAYASLKLCIHTIALACFANQLPLYKSPPCSVKEIVSGDGHASKEKMYHSIKDNPNITIKTPNKPNALDKLTEHEIDAISVGWAFAQAIPNLILGS